MQKTITLNEALYAELSQRAGSEDVDRFIENMLWKLLLVTDDDDLSEEEIEASYREKAADEEAEREAHEWAEAFIGETLP
ncbi:MAG: hypothetical protein WEC79_05490 [Thermomicrobiales bacterium]